MARTAERTDLHDTVTVRLRRAGQRYTRARRALVELLDGAGRPLTIPEVLDRDDDLAQSSAYRNLAVLEDAGVVARIVTHDDFARYELAEDLTRHHHHLVCEVCGAVEDFELAEELEADLDAALVHVAHNAGFTGGHHRLDLIGVCGRCGPG